MLPVEGTNSLDLLILLDLLEKQALLVAFGESFCQKLGTVYSPNGPFPDFEVAGDRNKFFDLQKIFLEVKCKIVQSSDADLKHDNTAAADVTETDAPYFCNSVLHSLFSDCTVSAKVCKFQMAMVTMPTKFSSKQTSFFTIKVPKAPGWHVTAIFIKRT